MDIRVGTSGWSFYDKENFFYPKEVKSRDRLKFFSDKFNTVEVNTTFYHFPRKTTIEKWYGETPADFKFIIKLNRYFTHERKFLIDEESLKKLQDFLNLIKGLNEKLGGVLIQIPGSFKEDLTLLESFLKNVEKIKKDKDYKLFLEVRDKSWITDEFFNIIKKHNTILVYNDGSKSWPKLLQNRDPFYMRLHGREKLYYSSYSKEELNELIALTKVSDLNNGYIFFNNTASSSGVENAIYLKEMLKCDII